MQSNDSNEGRIAPWQKRQMGMVLVLLAIIAVGVAILVAGGYYAYRRVFPAGQNQVVMDTPAPEAPPMLLKK